MANFLHVLGETIGSLIRSKQDEMTISKDDIVESCQTTLVAQTTLEYSLSNINKSESIALGNQLKNSGSRALADAYRLYFKTVGPAGQKMDATTFLGSLLEAHKRLAKIAKEIIDNVDELLKDKQMTANNTRVTHAAMMGVIRNMNVITSFTIYLLDCTRADYLGKLQNIPKYRLAFLEKNAASVATIVRDILDKSGKYSFLAELSNVRKKGQDLLLYTEGQSISTYGSESNYTPIKGFLTGFNPLMIFYYPAKIYEDYKHAQYLRNQQLKSWMEARAALMRLKMQDIDPSDPEYKKLEDIVNNYDELITKYDQQINKYLQGE